MHLSDKAAAESVPFDFYGGGGRFSCQEGGWYSAQGERKKDIGQLHRPQLFSPNQDQEFPM